MTHEMFALAKATPAQLDLAMAGAVAVAVAGVIAGIWIMRDRRRAKDRAQATRAAADKSRKRGRRGGSR